MAIRTFSDKATEEFFYAGTLPKGISWASVASVAKRKLDMVNAAADVSDLRVPPKNKLEKLKKNLLGFWSIRINDQFRVVFRWENGGAEDVRIADYH